MTTNKKELVSPYRLAMIVGVRPQMVYNYIREGYIKSTLNELGKKQVDLNEASVVKFIAKRTTK